jgi:DNA-directed RNA polymerase sigma subunit (sigma70/sigma32)
MTEADEVRSILRIAAVEARKAKEWTVRRNRAICAASRAGASLREIGDATGLSHEAVRKIVANVTKA